MVLREEHSMALGHWLVKSEPSTYGWEQLVAEKRTRWTGVRNFTARNHLAAMKTGDLVFYYHSGEGKEIVGVAKVTAEAVPDPTAKAGGSGGAGMSRYARVKGESEEAVRASGPAVVSVFRPAMIIGSQHTPWLLEKTLPLFSFVMPAKYQSIHVEQIAKAMIATAKHHPATSATYHYPEMMALIASGQR